MTSTQLPPDRRSTFPGYSLAAEIHRGRKRAVYRAVRDQDGAGVILKTLVDDYPSPSETAALRREFELLRGLDIRGVAVALGLESYRDRLALVLEDAGGDSLKTLVAQGPLDLDRFFAIALPLVAAIARIHERGVIHKDINPSNVLVNLAQGEVRVIDFSISSRLAAEHRRHLQHPHLLEGTIAYMSPEQTGRMNRGVDYRSDLYSFGATCYEMLTGQRLFESNDPLEVIHGHVAQAPVPPHTRDPRIPRVLSDLILRLLAKTVEDRYQSAEGVEADLRRCRDEWRDTGRITPFPLGQADVRGRFVLPQRLYGREQEVARLTEAFERVAEGGAELVLVSGYSGIGKTSLIQELHRSLPRRRGQIITGKCDQLARDRPYGALAQAFQGLLRHILAGTDAEVAGWRERVQTAVGGNGQVVIEVVPELAHLLGPQPPVAPLDPTESQNRFNRVFLDFVGAFARAAHPLVLFLDDVQWADAATLTLLPLLVTRPELTGLLVIGAYRSNEVHPTHPLMQIVESLRGRGARVTELVLPPLDPDHLRALVGDALAAPASLVEELSAVVLEKTAGNPFFVIQFLSALHQDGQIAFDDTGRAWRVDLDAIRSLRMTDNVVDLMTGRIQRLGEPTRRVLRLAACIGNRFDLGTLAVVAETEPAAVAGDLWPAVDQGLVISEEQSYGIAPDPADARGAELRRYHFLHDRVQQAAYALIPDAAKPQAHLTVGRLLLERGHGDGGAEWLFDVVHHLNMGAGLMTDATERLRLAELNLQAGRRAKASAAFPSAHGYFAAGAALLPEEAWDRQHALAFALRLELAESEYLTGRLEDAERAYEVLLERAATPLESSDAYLLMMNQYETTARYYDAIRAGMAALRLLGFALPETEAEQRAALEADIAAIRASLADRPVAVLLDLPRLESPAVRAALKLLMILWSPAYISGQNRLSDLVGARMVRLSLEHGNAEESAYGHVAFAMTVGWVFGDYAQGYEFGRLGIALNERLADLRLRGRVHHRFAALVNFWRQPFATSIPHAQEAVRAGLESGDFMIAAYGQFQQSWWGMHIDPDLAGFLERYQPTVDFLERMRAQAYREVQKMILQWARALQGRTTAPTSLTGEGFDESAFLSAYGSKGIFGSWYVTLKLELLQTFGALDEARAAARDWEPVAELFSSSPWPAMFAFRHALILCDWIPGAPGDERAAALAKADALAARIRIWADNAPDNFEHMYHLVAAGLARIRGQASAAFEHFEAALAAAQRLPSPRYRALANERYGEFWLARQQPDVAAPFLREAQFGYRQWGALAKVADLERRHGALLTRRAAPGAGPIATTATTQTAATALDIHTVIKVSQAIASEMDLELLLGRLMRMAIEHAGAERGHLVLEYQGAPAVHVTGTTAGVEVQAQSGTPLAEATGLPVMLVNLVRRTGETVVLADAAVEGPFVEDPYIRRERTRSIVCTPLMNQARLTGVLYLENNLAAGVFTADRAQILQMIAAQAAIAVENARLFAEIARLKDRLQAENVYLAEEIKTQQGFEEMVGHAPTLQRALARVEQVAPTDSTVLITGETGTGKELVARAIHTHSRRRDQPLVSVNCGAISPGLVESELFGHEKGAFTGALGRKIGRFELADGGTIFLDEIGDLPLDLQVKLLRVLQEGEIERVGGIKPIRVDVRVVAATHRDIRALVDEGRFRADLYYRLNVFPIHMPALRERREDIPALARHFVLKYAARFGKTIETIPAETLAALSAYDWPGNIRELGNVIERSVIVSRGGTLELGDWIVPQAPRAAPSGAGPAAAGGGTLEQLERARILEALEQTRWRVSGPKGAAVRLGLKPTTLESRMKRLGIVRPG
ncbi:MAG TPA: sigma 54-interacting transcriptional regulator [Gemmatimonadales bacterium]|nr:sigma 54-interacting transcriptional regulator [Gemmatimonadales bacterium]